MALDLEKQFGKLGFGLLRLPKNEDGSTDIEHLSAMVDLFLESGYNYFDTARIYEGSEEAIRKALVDRHPREAYQLATKNAGWFQCDTPEEARKQFDTSREVLGVDYFDAYLLHSVGDVRTQRFEEFGMWEWLAGLKEKGLAKYTGFSFHDKADVLDRVLTAHPEVDFVQLQLNYGDWENYAIQSRACYETARRHGKPIVVMEPVKGGLLSNPPDSVKEVLRRGGDYTWTAWAMQFVANLEGVATVLSGLSTLEQARENIALIQNFTGLSDAELDIIREAREVLERVETVPCTSCEYCAKACPENVGISGSFLALNHYLLYDDLKYALFIEGRHTRGKEHADHCIGCGLCEKACPQHIEIREQLERVTELLLSKR